MNEKLKQIKSKSEHESVFLFEFIIQFRGGRCRGISREINRAHRFSLKVQRFNETSSKEKQIIRIEAYSAKTRRPPNCE